MKKQTKAQRENRRITVALITRFTQSVHHDGFAYAAGGAVRELDTILGMVILAYNLSLIEDGEMMRLHEYLGSLRDMFRRESEKYSRNESQRRFNHF